MLNTVKTAGKYLDQPLLVAKFSKAVPSVLLGGSALYTVKKVYDAPNDKKKYTAINTGMVLGATALSALAAPKLAAKAVGKQYKKISVKEIQAANTELINNFLDKNQISQKVQTILEKGKTKVLGIKEIFTMNNELSKNSEGKKFMNTFIPQPNNITSKDIVQDMGRLSVFGIIPVAGGIAGGIAGDIAVDKENWKKKVPNKIKEGAYQYLANIFLCNVGAAIALGIMEATKVKSKAVRAVGMIGGIIATGIVGGSAIANYISKKAINPMFDKKKPDKKESLMDERTPEALDICLHSDDIATIAVMSGFRWIEPALPILYAISGYRAGIGYRNGKSYQSDESSTKSCPPNAL